MYSTSLTKTLDRSNQMNSVIYVMTMKLYIHTLAK